MSGVSTRAEPILLLVTGAGRSGTSTMSGALQQLGLSVPGPYLGANPTNPKGFFESKWSVDFHKRIHKRARINDFDGRLDAPERAREATDDEARQELDAWLAEQQADQVVVKDPRTVWHHELWAERVEKAGRQIRYVSMLRHPAEVIGSRATYYAHRVDDLSARGYAVCNLARWLTSSLVSEEATRGRRRAFVRYDDMLADWRTTMTRVGGELGLRYDSDLAPGVHHPVDDFVDPDLRRVRAGWGELDVTTELRDLAQGTWENLGLLADTRGADEEASAALDALRERHARLIEASEAMAYDTTNAARATGRAAGAKAARRKLRRQAPAGG